MGCLRCFMFSCQPCQVPSGSWFCNFFFSLLSVDKQKMLSCCYSSITNSPSLKQLNHRQQSRTRFTKDIYVSVNIGNSVSSTGKAKVFPWQGLFLPGMQCRQRGKQEQRRHFGAFVPSDICNRSARFDQNDLQ